MHVGILWSYMPSWRNDDYSKAKLLSRFKLGNFDVFHVLTALQLNYTIWFQTRLFTQAVACKIWVYFEMLLCTCGMQIMVIICISRYLAVLHPLKPPICRRKLRLLPVILFVTVSIYLIPYIAVFEYSTLKGCYKEWSNKTFGIIYTVFSMSIHYILPVTVMSVLYYKICNDLIYQTNKMNSLLQNESGPRGQESLVGIQETDFQRIRHHRNTRTFLVSAVSVGIFATALIPFEIWWISDANNFGIFKSDYAGWFYLSYMIGSSSVNPFIYGVLDKKLVESFKRSVKKGTTSGIGILSHT